MGSSSSSRPSLPTDPPTYSDLLLVHMEFLSVHRDEPADCVIWIFAFTIAACLQRIPQETDTDTSRPTPISCGSPDWSARGLTQLNWLHTKWNLHRTALHRPPLTMHLLWWSLYNHCQGCQKSNFSLFWCEVYVTNFKGFIVQSFFKLTKIRIARLQRLCLVSQQWHQTEIVRIRK